MPAGDIHVGPSDHVPWLDDRKWAYIRMEGTTFGDVPLNVELKMEVWDSPNSAGVVIDATVPKGDIYIGLIVDAGSVVGETSELNNVAFLPVAVDPDSDGDSVLDGVEVVDPLHPQDTDLDGVDNLAEQAAGGVAEADIGQ